MTRQRYIVTSDRGHHVVKFAWNAALRTIETLMREIAVRESRGYKLQGHATVTRDDCKIRYLRLYVGGDKRINWTVVREGTETDLLSENKQNVERA